jgi:hypothetical protein
VSSGRLQEVEGPGTGNSLRAALHPQFATEVINMPLHLGKSGIVVPALGVSVWSWGDKNTWGYGNSDTRADVTQAYWACLDAGLNFFDTAEIYGEGL